jgi:hypothetical protein
MTERKVLMSIDLSALNAVTPASWELASSSSPLTGVSIRQYFDEMGPRTALAMTAGNHELGNALERARIRR